VDAIQEFKVVTNAPPAEFGRFNGGVINLSTRAGGNELHGAAFEFLRNEALNARNLFAPATADNPDKPDFRRNQFGFVLGGPIAKDRTFFFVDYQGTRQSLARVRISTVPTALQRQGIFTEAVGGRVATIYDPATGRPAPSGGGTTRDPFAGNTIPAARVDPVASSLLGRYPLPNLPGPRTTTGAWRTKTTTRISSTFASTIGRRRAISSSPASATSVTSRIRSRRCRTGAAA
jgi:hypothetical protein